MAEHPQNPVKPPHAPMRPPTAPPTISPDVNDAVLFQVVKLRTLAAYLTARKPQTDLHEE